MARSGVIITSLRRRAAAGGTFELWLMLSVSWRTMLLSVASEERHRFFLVVFFPPARRLAASYADQAPWWSWQRDEPFFAGCWQLVPFSVRAWHFG